MPREYPPARRFASVQSFCFLALVSVMVACGGGGMSTPTAPKQTPTITSFAPTSGIAGDAVTISGMNLSGATAVRFNGTTATFSVTGSTSVTTSVPAGATTGKITVTTSSGTAASASDFTISTNAPSISNFTPTSGLVGASVTITGTKFTGATAVKFNGTTATMTVNSDTQITAVVPTGATTGKITVTTSNGTATSAANFTVTPPAPTITGFNPTSGAPATPVTLTGANFTGASSVQFNGVAASFTVVNAGQISTTVPAAATSGKITVTTAGGTATSAADFTVNTSSATLDLTIDGLYVTQATQNYPAPAVPLVKDRSAWVRVFVKANQANSVMPQVRVRFINGATTNTLNISAPLPSVPTTIDANTATSWDAAVPSAWMQPSTQVIADVDPATLIQESNKSNNSFTLNLDVRALKQWKITLVPVKTGSLTGTVTSATRTKESWLDTAKRVHPVADAIDIAVGSTMTSSVSSLSSSGTGWSTVLNELDAKRTADGATSRYYYGAVHASYTSGVAGLGFIGHPAAIGWDFFPSATFVLAHEEGHNFGREHSPCGGVSNPDPNYPYPGGIIGVPGWDAFATSGNLKDESNYTDIMGYCSTQWISDYTYKGELAFRAASSLGDVIPDVTNATLGDGLLIWGRIENGKVTLEPAFRTQFLGNLPAPGQYQVEARDLAGNVLSSQSFEAYQVEDLPEGESVRLFSFVLPMPASGIQSVASLRLAMRDGQELTRRVTRESSGEISQAAPLAESETAVQTIELPNHAMQFRWDADRYPVLMVRDQKTGEVRGFLRGGQAEMEDAPADLDLQLSDGVRSRRQTHHRVTE